MQHGVIGLLNDRGMTNKAHSPTIRDVVVE